MVEHKAVIVDTSRSPRATLKPVAINEVRIEDDFWAQRLTTLREVTLPSQHEQMESTGRLDNFRRAARLIEADFRGIFFNDSDVYKWMEALSFSVAYEPSARLQTMLDEAVNIVTAAQDEDGYLNTYFTFDKKGERWTNLRDMHELYCAGHLIQAAIAHRRATGDERLFTAARRFADHIASVFGPGRRDGTCGHPEPEMALVELYRETGDAKYLELAKFLLDRRGYGVIGGGVHHIDHKPFRELTAVEGHAVRSLYLNAGATDILMETGDPTLGPVLERLWDNLVHKRMYVTGGAGARHAGESFGEDYELPNDTAYAETCAAIANFMWNWRMLLMTGEARFSEIMELALYNGVLSGWSLDGKQYFYVNPLCDRGSHRRQDWFACACCPPNVARTYAALPGYVFTRTNKGFQVHMYVDGTLRTHFAGQPIRLTVRRDGWTVRVRLLPDAPVAFELSLRVPGWASSAKVLVNNELVDEPAPHSYATVEREWEPGDTVDLELHVEPQFIVAHPWVQADAGRVAMRHGPFVYCLEQEDNSADVWDIVVDPAQGLQAVERPDILGGVTVLQGRGVAPASEGWEGQLYRPLARNDCSLRAVTFTAIPYCLWANRRPGPMHVWPLARLP